MQHVTLPRSRSAAVCHALGLKGIARKLDPLVDTRDSERTRELCILLSAASVLGSGIGEDNLQEIVQRFTSMLDIRWDAVSRYHQKKAERLLWRTARRAHPQVALLALARLWRFTPEKIKAGLRTHLNEPEGLADIGKTALPYLVHQWTFAKEAFQSDMMVEAIREMRDVDAVPYLKRLAGIQHQQDQYTALGEAAEHAWKEIENQLTQVRMDIQQRAFMRMPNDF